MGEKGPAADAHVITSRHQPSTHVIGSVVVLSGPDLPCVVPQGDLNLKVPPL